MDVIKSISKSFDDVIVLCWTWLSPSYIVFLATLETDLKIKMSHKNSNVKHSITVPWDIAFLIV